MTVGDPMCTGMKTSAIWIGWIVCLTLVAACSTTNKDDPQTRPRAQAMGHGTTPGSSWAGVGITIPFPGKGNNSSSPPSGQDSKESGKP